MFHFLILCLLYGLSILLASKVVPGLKVRSYGGAVLFAAVFSILDALLFRALLFFTFPLILLTLGLGIFVLRAVIFYLANRIVSGVQVNNFWAALLGSFVSGVINFILTHFILS